MANYGIARCEKRGSDAIGGVEAENNRSADNQIDLPKSDIDWRKTKDNIFLVRSDNWYQAIKDKISEFGVKRVRKDSILMIDTIYTASAPFFAEHSQEEAIEYFRDCLSFHEDRFGKDNIINAVIHLDESGAPHMHVVHVPIVNREDHYVLSAKDQLGNRQKYYDFQNTFYDNVSSKWDLERGETKDPIERKIHKDTLDYKIETRQAMLDQLEAEIEDKVEHANRILEVSESIGNDIRVRTEALESLKIEASTIEHKIDVSSEKLSNMAKLEALIDRFKDFLADRIEIVKDRIENLLARLERREPVSILDLENTGYSVGRVYEDKTCGIIIDNRSGYSIQYDGHVMGVDDTDNNTVTVTFAAEYQDGKLIDYKSDPSDLDTLFCPDNRDFDTEIDSLEDMLDYAEEANRLIQDVQKDIETDSDTKDPLDMIYYDFFDPDPTDTESDPIE